MNEKDITEQAEIINRIRDIESNIHHFERLRNLSLNSQEPGAVCEEQANFELKERLVRFLSTDELITLSRYYIKNKRENLEAKGVVFDD